MYTNLHGTKGVERKYVGDVMSMSAITLQTHAVPISDDVKYSSGKSFCAWRVPAKFNPPLFINDP